MDKNNILKLIAILSALFFLISLVSLPKTHCQACKISYEGRIIDGYEAWDIFEEGCISYNNPWDAQPVSNLNETNFTSNNITPKNYVYVDIDDINFSEDKNGIKSISFPEEYLE